MKSEKTARGATVAVLLAVLLAGCASSTDGFVEEGSQDDTVEHNVIKGLMQSMGAVDPSEKPIDYRPRAPLVVPPNRDLPPPGSGAAAGPNFPRNPEDVADEQRRNAGAGLGRDGRIMTPEEMSRYSIAGAGRPSGGPPKDMSRPLSPDELRGQGAIQADAIKRAANPSGRQSLTEPPDTYRQPSPNAPVAAPEEKKSSWWPF